MKKKRLILAITVLCLLALYCLVQFYFPDETDSPVASDTTIEQSVPSGNQSVVSSPAACSGHASDPYVGVDKAAFYADYTPACCYTDACYRTQHFLMSGMLSVPDQYAVVSEHRPTDESGTLIRNTDCYYLDGGSTYVVVDAYGNEVLRVYKGAAYITLEEVAAYMYAFGGSNRDLPANYISQKPTKVGTSPWGIYLRGNHSRFTGNTNKYPYEPVLPDISGCGGDLQYYEMDIGTTGTYTGKSHPFKVYNDGNSITRGAARLVYARMDKNSNGVYENDELYVFYTANHYNDFREYLNYYGGWGEVFGNETGGGTLSSTTDYNPTPYVPTVCLGFGKLYE